MIVKDVDVRDTTTARELLGKLGLDDMEIDEVVDAIEHDYEESRNHGSYEGLLGDDYYTTCDAVKYSLDEIRDEAMNLYRNSRKGNTRADIADRLKIIAENIDNEIGFAVYEF